MADAWKKFNCNLGKLKTNKDKLPSNEAMDCHLIPRPPFSHLFCGASGSGKSTNMIQMLTREELYKDYWDEVILMAPTGKSDSIFKHLGLDDECIITEPCEDHLIAIFETMGRHVEEKGIEKSPKVLVILDDCVSEVSFLRSKSFLKLFTMNRHYNISVMVLTQSFKSIPRAARVNCTALTLFPCSTDELEKVCEANAINGLSKRQTMEVFGKALKQGPHPYLYVNNQAPVGLKYRAGLSGVLGY